MTPRAVLLRHSRRGARARAGLACLTAAIVVTYAGRPASSPLVDASVPAMDAAAVLTLDTVSALTLPAALMEKEFSTTLVATLDGLVRRDAVPGWTVITFEPWVAAYGSSCQTIWSPVEVR
jgi:hypothetical protein